MARPYQRVANIAVPPGLSLYYARVDAPGDEPPFARVIGLGKIASNFPGIPARRAAASFACAIPMDERRGPGDESAASGT